MERRKEMIFRWQNHTASQHRTAPQNTRHIVFCVKVTPRVGKVAALEGLAKAWTTVDWTTTRFLACRAG